MQEILNLLPVLIVSLVMNIGTGAYYNIGTKQMNFNYKILLVGITKAVIIASTFVGTAYCFDATDLSSIGVTPLFIMNAAITLYVGKTLISLGKILGVNINEKKE